MNRGPMWMMSTSRFALKTGNEVLFAGSGEKCVLNESPKLDLKCLGSDVLSPGNNCLAETTRSVVAWLLSEV